MNAEGPADPADAFGAFFIYAADRQRRCERKILAGLGVKKGARRPTYTAQHLFSKTPGPGPQKKDSADMGPWEVTGSYRILSRDEQLPIRTTRCRKHGSQRCPSRRENAPKQKKRHAIVTSRSGHHSVRRSVTKWRGRPMRFRSMRGPRFSPYAHRVIIVLNDHWQDFS